MNFVLRALLCLFCLSLCACGGGGSDAAEEVDLSPAGSNYKIHFRASAFPELEEGVYEAWLDYGMTKKSLGRFSSAEDRLFELETDPALASRFFVTIEWSNDPELQLPSSITILSGDIQPTGATLSFGADFSEKCAGEFMMNAISDYCGRCSREEEDRWEARGVWFVRCADEPGTCYVPSDCPDCGEDYGVHAGLYLPPLPDGWTYEGWVIMNSGRSFTTGRFSHVDGADSSSPHFASTAEYMYGDSPITPFDFPGEDFLEGSQQGVPVSEVDARNARVVVSVEPYASNYDDPTGNYKPFSIQILSNEGPWPGAHNTLTCNRNRVPSGSVEFIAPATPAAE